MNLFCMSLIALQIFIFSTADYNQVRMTFEKGLGLRRKREVSSKAQKSSGVLPCRKRVKFRTEGRKRAFLRESQQTAVKKVSVEAKGKRIILTTMGLENDPVGESFYDQRGSDLVNKIDKMVDYIDDDTADDELVYTIFDYDEGLSEENLVAFDQKTFDSSSTSDSSGAFKF